ncbi:hypothetical protein BC936DRAFT_141755 [Jimgerdemannia flammicorona]|uniref:Zn(2)-C6 fungal-type domain-containing protein n=1 Tax=Jimgerdemannia flammicorona TaxID=994334 RepID=A0A433DFT3_9FUNG|nr:hypothetical protein BC936DRAFT_141755 [Jimgerdemannia flammicorona]
MVHKTNLSISTATDRDTPPPQHQRKAPCLVCSITQKPCDFKQPKCMRCMKGGFACCYPDETDDVSVQTARDLQGRLKTANERLQRLMLDIMANPLAAIPEKRRKLISSPEQTGLDDPSDSGYEDAGNLTDPEDDARHEKKGRTTVVKAEGPGMMPNTWKLSRDDNTGFFNIETDIQTVTELYTTFVNLINEGTIVDLPISIFGGATSPLSPVRRQSLNANNPLRREYGYIVPAPSTIRQLSDLLVPLNIDSFPVEMLDSLMHIYLQCSSYQPVDKAAILEDYISLKIPSVLQFSIWAATALHAHRCHFSEEEDAHLLEKLAKYSYKQARSLLDLDDTSWETFEVLINMQLYLMAVQQIRSAYTHFTMAVRMAQMLRLDDLCRDQSLSRCKRENYKRMWMHMAWYDLCYATYASQRTLMFPGGAVELGNPPTLQRLDTDDEYAAYRVEFLNYAVAGLNILVHNPVPYDPQAATAEELPPALWKLLQITTNWRESLSPIFAYPAEVPVENWTLRHRYLFCLHAQYFIVVLSVHKPYITLAADGDAELSKVGGFARKAMDICTRCADAITEIVQAYADARDYCCFMQIVDGVSQAARIHMINASRTDSDSLELALRARANLEKLVDLCGNGPMVRFKQTQGLVSGWEEFLSSSYL